MGRGQIGLVIGQCFRNRTLRPCMGNAVGKAWFRTKVKGRTVIYKECLFKKKKKKKKNGAGQAKQYKLLGTG